MAKSFKELFSKAKESAEYWAEVAALDFTEALNQRMQELNVTRSELASRIDASPAYITKIMNGTTNFTLRSMATLAHALGKKVKIAFEDEDFSENSLTAAITYPRNDPIHSRGYLILVQQQTTFENDAENESNISLPLKVA